MLQGCCCCVLADNESKPAAAQNKHSSRSASSESTDVVFASKNENNHLRRLRLTGWEGLGVWGVKSTQTQSDDHTNKCRQSHSKSAVVT